jgi:hypothetical protein
MERLTWVHLKDLDDRHEAWQMIARPETRQKAAGQRHDSITETSFDGGAPVILHPTQSQCPSPLFFCLITASPARLSCGLLGSWMFG